jgi:hypothetical protein
VEAQQRDALFVVKLTALVRDHVDAPVGRATPIAGGAALVHDDTAWVLAEESGARALGPAMAWGEQQGARRVSVIATERDATGVLARRAASFINPPDVWIVEGRLLLPAVAAPIDRGAALPAGLEELTELIRAAGADPVVEHGVLTGEVAGLEVLRAVVDPDGSARLLVGLGNHDREANEMVYGAVPPVSAIEGLVTSVRTHRMPGAPPHGLGRQAQGKLLRDRVLHSPGAVGATELAGVAPPIAVEDRNAPGPAVAYGRDASAKPIVVVFSVGIDLDLVPFAADARLATDSEARLVLAMPERDAHPITRRLADRLVAPAEIVTVDLWP